MTFWGRKTTFEIPGQLRIHKRVRDIAPSLILLILFIVHTYKEHKVRHMDSCAFSLANNKIREMTSHTKTFHFSEFIVDGCAYPLYFVLKRIAIRNHLIEDITFLVGFLPQEDLVVLISLFLGTHRPEAY